MAKKANIKKKVLYREYVINGKDTVQLAKEWGYSSTTISNYLRSFEIKSKEKLKQEQIDNISKQELIKKYHREKKSIQAIAQELNLNLATIRKLFVKYNIVLRSAREIAIARPPKMSPYQEILTEDFLIKEYIINKKSAIKIAKLVGCSTTPVYTFLKKFNLTRSNSEAHRGELHNFFGKKRPEFAQKISGTNNANWKGKVKRNCNFCGNEIEKFPCFLRFISFCNKDCQSQYFKGKNSPVYIHGESRLPYPPEWNETLKAKIRERDNYICQCCGIKEQEYYLKDKKTNLSVHHIDYNKENCNEDNLITLCHSCNTKANADCNYWYAYYKWIIENEILIVQ